MLPFILRSEFAAETSWAEAMLALRVESQFRPSDGGFVGLCGVLAGAATKVDSVGTALDDFELR